VHLGATLGVLLGGISTGMQEGIMQWSSYIGSTADAAVKAAEASFGMEGAHEAMLAKAQAVVMATDGFTAQVCFQSLHLKLCTLDNVDCIRGKQRPAVGHHQCSE